MRLNVGKRIDRIRAFDAKIDGFKLSVGDPPFRVFYQVGWPEISFEIGRVTEAVIKNRYTERLNRTDLQQRYREALQRRLREDQSAFTAN